MKGLAFLSNVSVAGVSASIIGAPAICVSSPPLPLEAGTSNVTALLDANGGRCEAILHFSDLGFLPVVYDLDSIPCQDKTLGSIHVPLSAPNGDANLVWQCAGQPSSCIRVNITGGKANTSLPLFSTGTVACLPVVTRTRTATMTIAGIATTVTQADAFHTTETITVFPNRSVSSTWWTENSADTTQPDHWSTIEPPGVSTTALNNISPLTSLALISLNAVSSPITTPQEISHTVADSVNITSTTEPTSNPADEVHVGDFTSVTSTVTVPILTATLISTLTVVKTVTSLLHTSCVSCEQ